MYDENHNIVGHKKGDDTLKTPESYRTIPLYKEDEAVLWKYKQKEKKRLGKNFKEDGYVFLNREGNPYTSEILTNKMPFFIEKWKLPHITPYGLRHSVASYLAKIGVKESVLKSIMGHTSISTTHKYYIHLTDDDIMEELIDKTQEHKNTEERNTNTDMRLDNIENMMKQMLALNQLNNIKVS